MLRCLFGHKWELSKQERENICCLSLVKKELGMQVKKLL